MIVERPFRHLPSMERVRRHWQEQGKYWGERRGGGKEGEEGSIRSMLARVLSPLTRASFHFVRPAVSFGWHRGLVFLCLFARGILSAVTLLSSLLSLRVWRESSAGGCGQGHNGVCMRLWSGDCVYEVGLATAMYLLLCRALEPIDGRSGTSITLLCFVFEGHSGALHRIDTPLHVVMMMVT